MSSDQKLRENRLVLYEAHMNQVERVMDEFLRKSGARCALLIDKDGHLVTSAGDAEGIDPDTISALVAGSFAATKEMARLLGEQEFSALFHQGEHDSIQLSLVGGRSILTVLFDDSTTLGMVRLYVTEAVRRLADILDRPVDGKVVDASEIDPSYGDSANKTLDDLFG